MLFSQLVDDPSSWPELFPTEEDQDRERQRLFQIIEELVKWENSNSERVIGAARREIARSLARNRRAEGEADERDEAVLVDEPEREAVNRYLAEVAPPVHDPFAGGGSIPLEAQRLGLRAIASDLNPVAVLINKALIEIPPKFADCPPVNPESRKKIKTWRGAEGLAEDVRYYGEWMRVEARKRIGHLYPQVDLPEEYGGGKATVIAWLWAWTVASPNPAMGGEQVPLVSSFWLSKKKGKETWVEPVVDRGARTYRFEIRRGKPGDPMTVGTGTKVGRGGNFRCILSGEPIPEKHVRSEASAGRMAARLMAVVAEGNRRRIYLAASAVQEEAAQAARPTWAPDFEMPKNPRWFSPPSYGMPLFSDLFTARQLVALTTFSDLVSEAKERILSEAVVNGLDKGATLEAGGVGAHAYAAAVAVYLALACNKVATRNSNQTTWYTDRDSTMAAFSRQAIPMVWDFAEVNPMISGTGTLTGAIRWLAKVLETALPLQAPQGIVRQFDARDIKQNEQVLTSTDPPYYDNVGYSDLSDFFYVWLRRTLGTVMPGLFKTLLTIKSAELIANPYRFEGNRDSAREYFESGLLNVFQVLNGIQTADAPIAIYYAFKQQEGKGRGLGKTRGVVSTGWQTMLEGLIAAGSQVIGTWPVRTEQPHGLRVIGASALASSIVLACRKRPADAEVITRSDFRRLLRQELPEALRHLQHGNIAPVDLAQASIGPGMAVFSRHSKVIEADGSTMTVRTALLLINQALDEYLAERDGEVDADTRFAVTWFETHGFEVGPFGEAETLAKARNVSVQGVVEAGILHSAAGKTRLLRRGEFPGDWDPTKDERLSVWEATQQLIKRLEEQGEAAAAKLLSKLGSTAEQAHDLAYRLYNTCERRGWAEEARAYNGLVIVWPDLDKLAAQRQAEGVQSELFSDTE